MNRRSFLTWIGLGSGVVATAGSITFQRGAPYHKYPPINYQEQVKLERLESELLDISVYGGPTVHSRDLLRQQTVLVRAEKRSGRVGYYCAEAWSLILEGPIAVSAVTCSMPASLQWIRKEITLPIYPIHAKDSDETIKILMPERVLSIS